MNKRFGDAENVTLATEDLRRLKSRKSRDSSS
jgi:hypothetical protein